MKGRLRTPEDVIKLIEKQCGSIFTYENFQYINDKTPMTLTCKKHGPIQIMPHTILYKGFRGCPECKKEKTFQTYITRWNQIHNYNFTYNYQTFINGYSKGTKETKYGNNICQLDVYCKKHQLSFQVSPYVHEKAYVLKPHGGCPKCKQDQIQEAFLNKVINKPYDYSQLNWVNPTTPVTIICKEHGEFKQTSDYHLTKYGICPKCILNQKQDNFLQEAKKRWNNRFNYDKFIFTGVNKVGIIRCLQHGEFEQQPVAHLTCKEPCPMCSNRNRPCQNQADFIERAKKIYEDEYDYSLVKYVNHTTPVKIICKYHGIFYTTPLRFLNRKVGCIKCSEAKSYSEHEIKWLNTLMVPIRLHKIDNYIVDGFNPDTKTIYEFLGDYWHGNLTIFKPDDINKSIHKTYETLNKQTFNRLNKLKNKGYNVVYIWENDWLNKKPAITL